MKKSMLVVLVVMLLALLSLSGNAQAGPGEVRTFVLSNELGPEGQGGLIDKLIAAGHGSKNFYQVLQLLAAQPGSGIPADFVTSVGSNPPGSDVFTAPLHNFTGLNGPVCINADGTLRINPIFGRDYDGHEGYVTSNATITGVARVSYTLASDATYFIDAGSSAIGGGPTLRYKAIGIAWVKAVRSFVLSNEAPGHLIDKLIASGHGSENLYQVLQLLAAQPGSGIPADFVTSVGSNLPGSEVFTAAFSNFAGLNGPVCINTDGTLTINSIFGRDYDGHTGFVTSTVQYSGIGPAKFTMATSPIYYIDAGASDNVGGHYQAIGIAWAGATQTGSTAALYFPHVDTSLPWQTEIAIINTSDQTVTGTLRALSNAGQLVDSKAVSLSAHGRRQITVADEFANHTGIGYIVFDTTSPAVQGYTKFYQAGKYRAAIPAVKEVNTSDIYISHIDSGTLWWTGVSLVNTTSATKQLTITFNNGQSVPYTLNANEHKAFIIRDLFSQPIQPDIKSAVITNASGVIGLELFGNIGGNDHLDGILLTDKTASTIYYLHVDNDGWWTGIVAYNPSESACTITITPYSAQGTPLSPVTRTLAGKEKYVGLVSQLGLPVQTAWFRIDSTRPLTGFELFSTVDDKQLAAYAGGSGPAKAGVFAKIEKSGWTGIAFVNTEAGAASVTLTAYNDNGAAVATQVLPVGGHAKVVNFAEAIFSQDIGGATYIAYSSDRNVVGFQLNGSSDGMMLDGLPSM